MAIKQVRAVEMAVPEFGLPKDEPRLLPGEYEARIAAARKRAAALSLDFLVTYGDREHFANVAYLTGHDPRFEEALLVLPVQGGRPTLVVGNEGMGYSELMPASVDRRLYQGFSLLGQPRDRSPRLEPILEGCSIKEGARVGLAGWKYAMESETDDPTGWLDAPAFIVDALRRITGDARLVTNATAIFMNPVDGLRTINSADQLAVFEFAATYCSQGVRNAIERLEPGVSEYQAARNMDLNGMPLSVHPNLSSGPRARLGLPSPSDRTIARGDPLFVALGLRGSLTARAGFVASGPSELPAESADYMEELVKPYYAAVATWYEQLGIGIQAGELHRPVEEALRGHGIGLALNAGHLIHLEEWLHSPVYPGSDIRMRSGMLVQCDIIPSNDPRLHTTNVEDTVALADEGLRDELSQQHPQAWRRIQARREFMAEVLGIKLKPEVLPFSNLPAVLQPFCLNPCLAMVVEA